MRPLLLPLALLTACAGPPGVRLCDDPPGTLIEPEFLRVGNADILSASVRYTGCADVDDVAFRLCADDDAWLDRTEARLQLWHSAEPGQCAEEQPADVEASLRGVRDEYERIFETDTATLTLYIGQSEVEYSFAPVEPD